MVARRNEKQAARKKRRESVLQMGWYLFSADNDDNIDEYQMAGICQWPAVVVLGNLQV